MNVTSCQRVRYCMRGKVMGMIVCMYITKENFYYETDFIVSYDGKADI